MGALEGLITTEQAAALTGYDEQHIRRLLRAGTVRGVKAGPTWLVDRADLLRYKAEMDALGAAKYDPTRK